MTSILILAASRDGALDPLAQAAGVTHKCLVPIAGEALILHPLQAALSMPGVGQVLISTDDMAGLRTIPALRRAEDQGRIRLVQSRANLTESVIAAGLIARFPLIITTADNVLLTATALLEFQEQSERSGASATLAFARRESVLAAHAEGQRRFYRFADGAFSNCNLYWMRRPEALTAARAFSGGGQFAKRPARIIAAFGLANLILFRLGRLRVETMMGRLSRLFGLAIRSVEMSDGRLAIDVDNARTHAIAETLLRQDVHAAA
jgi:GTP:adenosylcobinamide-phosphate guanylyltransferase